MNPPEKDNPNLDINAAIVCIRRCKDLIQPQKEGSLAAQYPEASRILTLSYLNNALKKLGASK